MTTATRNAFYYGITESIAQTAVTYSLTAAQWGVLTYDFLTSPEAKGTYKWVKEMTIALGQLVFWSVVWAYAKTAEWAEAEVQGCIATDDHIANAGEMVATEAEVKPHCPAAVAAPSYHGLTTAQPKQGAKPMTKTQRLRKECAAAGIRWRDARGKNLHMTNAQMIEALEAI